MRKYVMAIVIFVVTLVSLPTATQAQFYSSYTYNNNAYLNYAIASQRAKATRNTGRSSRRTHRTRRSSRSHRHSRR